VWSGGTFSTFNKTSSMPSNSVTAGTVVLGDNDSGTTPLAISGLMPGGATSTACEQVSYTGTAPATVRLWGTVGGTGLAPYLNFKITRGTFSGTPSAGSCTGFTADASGSVLFNSTLDNLPTSAGAAIADPSSSWTSGDKRGYKLELWVPSGAGTGGQGLNATLGLTWQAVST
jgi:hypothetical protein